MEEDPTIYARDLHAVQRLSKGASELTSNVVEKLMCNIFATLQCETLDDHPDAPSFLLIDKSVDCESPFHTAMMGYAALMVLVYPIGTPLLYAMLIYANRKQLEEIKTLELAAAARTARGASLSS